eukprot:scaffold273599_cov35-Tisochrysis_lutea.AAC.3
MTCSCRAVSFGAHRVRSTRFHCDETYDLRHGEALAKVQFWHIPPTHFPAWTRCFLAPPFSKPFPSYRTVRGFSLRSLRALSVHFL